jgi:opacity protein-like surface antigen
VPLTTAPLFYYAVAAAESGGGDVSARIILLTIAAAATPQLAAAQGSADNTTPPPWVGQDHPLLFEAGVLGALAVGGRFKLDDGGATGTGTGSRVTLADHGAFALTADLRAEEGAQYELFYSREATDLRGNAGAPRSDVTVEYLHLGGTLLLDDEQRFKPFIAGGLGITRFTPGEEGSTDTRFSISLGLGLKWPLTQHFSLRLEGRGFVTLVDSDSAVFCRSDQNGLLCRVRGSGKTFVQGEFLAGVAFAF